MKRVYSFWEPPEYFQPDCNCDGECHCEGDERASAEAAAEAAYDSMRDREVDEMIRMERGS